MYKKESKISITKLSENILSITQMSVSLQYHIKEMQVVVFLDSRIESLVIEILLSFLYI